MTHQNKRLAGYISQLTVIGLLTIGIINFQKIIDEYVLYTYTPNAEISKIVDRIDITRSAKAYLYRSDPVINQKADFNTNCQTSAIDIELGCYYQNRIYVLKIDNAKLSSEMDVVLSHELLHAAWDRMSKSQQAALEPLLESSYAQIDDPELKERMDRYAVSEPGQRSNELHSILGTEYKDLSKSLEQYYSQYFNDRSKIVDAHLDYKEVFDSRRAELESQLLRIRQQKADLEQLNLRLEALLKTNSISAYNSLVPQQNNLVENINKNISQYKAGAEEYNNLSRVLDSQQIDTNESTVQ